MQQVIVFLDKSIKDGVEEGAALNVTDVNDRLLVFCNTKKEADRVDRHLHRQGFRSACVHGGKSQAQRNHGVQLFRDGQANVLVATSVSNIISF